MGHQTLPERLETAIAEILFVAKEEPSISASGRAELCNHASSLYGILAVMEQEREDAQPDIADDNEEETEEVRFHSTPPEMDEMEDIRDEANQEAIEAVIEKYPHAVKDYRDGKPGAMNFLVGQVMAKTGGHMDPGLAKGMLEDEILHRKENEVENVVKRTLEDHAHNARHMYEDKNYDDALEAIRDDVIDRLGYNPGELTVDRKIKDELAERGPPEEWE